jgi:DnaJ-class molecular chaperone
MEEQRNRGIAILQDHPAWVTLAGAGSALSLLSIAIQSLALGLTTAGVVIVTGVIVSRHHKAGRRIAPKSMPATIPTEEAESKSPTLTTRQWLDCRYCNGNGAILAYWDKNHRQSATCPICSGRGRIFTDLWSQPDCRRCNGSGQLMTTETTVYSMGRHVRRKNCETVYPCDVCKGYGKESPHEPL